MAANTRFAGVREDIHNGIRGIPSWGYRSLIKSANLSGDHPFHGVRNGGLPYTVGPIDEDYVPRKRHVFRSETPDAPEVNDIQSQQLGGG